ncbi:MAG: polymerase, archaea type [Methanobacterium sp.]|uniref:DNA polymerase domain-containing protein n=1 Tax=Methanobacterium sp. TaxID=2164 RepID=UPI0003C92443|nr:DNA polymerase domain-containing protein [Methanobacterium sp.]MDI3550442.1 polymerase, archaea type [Methanobacterium sp.]CDG64701.1 DNA polymerase [Methanobacterium sp. MB1]
MQKEIEDRVNEFLNTVNQELPPGMELEFEGFYERGFFVTKKRYALIQDDKIVVKGLELVRRDWAPVAKKTQEKVMMAILKDASPDKAAKIIREVIAQIKKGETPLEDLVIHTQLTKNPDKYQQMAPHVLAAKKAIARGRKVGRGSIIRYIVVKGKGPISQRAEPLEDADVANYDPDYYIDNQVLPAVSRIIDSLGYSPEEIVHQEKQSSLDAFFN